jgi:t-SNARE complex subunit (syntaxin)
VSEVKNIIISIIIFILWSVGCFLSGYILSNRQAIKRIEQSNNELAEKQRELDELIKSTDDRIRNIREQLLAEISNNGATTKELSKLVEQIRKQRINIQI